jgi:hypothetical protein
MKIVGFKFGKDTVTVKYEEGGGTYTLVTGKEPRSELYGAAADIADETRDVMGFKFIVSFSALSIIAGEKESLAAIALEAGTALDETAEIKCPKIGRKKIIDLSAVGAPPLPGMDANTAVERYAKHENLNLAIDVFLKEAERFARDCGKGERGLFDGAAAE